MVEISKELKKLGRSELVDIIYQLKKNEEELQEEITQLKNELKEQRISISKAGSIADAAVSVTNVFSSAQSTADIYLREIEHLKETTEKECEIKVAAAETRVKQVLAEGEKKFNTLKAHYKSEYIRWQQLQAEIAELEQKKKELTRQ